MSIYVKLGTIAITALSLTLSSAIIAGEDKKQEEGHSQKQAHWDVNTPPVTSDFETVSIDVNSGTWISLDVSPDGKNIAFDLLGDIYVMPISGGQATPVTSGLAWDIQPRFSPDGTRIAFTSDRAGGDNIWHMDTSGGDLKQLTKENFRLLNNPTWSPDGKYIAARKHFTTARSAGTGEIWLYHLDGGKGIAVVERPNKNFQKELGEPMFAPDGGSIYYSQNTTPGNTFIYAQDSNKELFQIRKVSLSDGRTETVAGGPGGAVRATPSPDGKKLAYVKRVRARSRLFLMDLGSGISKMLFDGLDQDNQETWAVQGIYPNMDWTPDSKNIVFWAKGKIWRINATNGVLSEIPFHVKDTRSIIPAVRTTVDVSPETFKTKMARFATPSPDGNSVVFESLGKLWLKTGEDAPKRLTRSNDVDFELFPVWSPDSKTVFYISWNDENLSEIRNVRVKNGRTKQLNKIKGHYTELALSPDGKTLLFRKKSGGGLMTPEWGKDPGIYRMPAAGGDMILVSRRGSDAHFANDGLIYVSERKNSKTSLISMNENGHDIKTIATSEHALSIKASPSGDHILWQENYHLYVSPLVKTGKPISLKTKSSGLPVKRITKNGALYPVWSTNSGSIYWSLGPTFKSVTLEDVFKDDFNAPENGTNLSITAKADNPGTTIAITGAKIITMNGDQIIEDGVIITDGTRIRSVGKSGEVTIPENAKIIDATGKTIIPGLIDIHAHGPYASGHTVPQQNWSAMAHLALGVTTTHNPSSRAHQVFAASEYQKAGLTLAPRIFSTAEIIYGAKQPLWAPIDNLDDALAHIRRLKAQGAISVKNYNQPRRDQRQQVVEAARREGMAVVAEGGSLYHMDMNMVADGNTGIEHTLPNQAIYGDVLQFWGQTNVGLVPTLVVAYGGIRGETYWYDKTEVWKHPILSRFVPPSRLQAASVRRIKAPDEDYGDAENAALAKQLMDQGVTISIGAHGQREGLAAHWEIWSFARGGMNTMEALATATINPAKYLGMDSDIGSIEAGKLADLIILEADPLIDIRNSDKVSKVMLGGRVYDSKTLREETSGTKKPKPFYWSGRPESDIR